MKFSDKKLRNWILIIVAIGYLSLHLLKVQVFPFFIFGMYSKPLEKEHYKYAYELRVDGVDLQFYQLGREEKDLLLGPLSYYMSHKKNGGEDPVKSFVLSKRPHWKDNKLFQIADKHVFTVANNLKEFPKWYCEFVSRHTGMEAHIIEVLESRYEFNAGKLQLVDKKKVCQFES